MWVRRSLCALLLLFAGWSHAATLVWDPNPPAEGVTGYRVYYGPAPGQYTGSVDVGTATEWEISVPSPQYLAITAYSASEESGYSAEVLWGVSAPTPSDPPAAATGVHVSWVQIGAGMSTWGQTSVQANADDGTATGGSWYASGFGGMDYIDDGTGWGASWALPAIAAGSTITKCYVRAKSNAEQAGTLTFKVGVQDIDPANRTKWGSSNLPTPSTTWIVAPSSESRAFIGNTWYFGEADTHPINLTTALQSLVDTYGAIAAGDTINIGFIKPTDGGGTYCGFYDYANSQANAAQLYIEWTEGGGGATLQINVSDCLDALALFGSP